MCQLRIVVVASWGKGAKIMEKDLVYSDSIDGSWPPI